MKRSCKKAFAAILTAVLLVNSVVSGTSSVFAETLDVIETMEEDSEKDSPETIETEETEPDSPESKNKESDTFETEESTVDADSDETEADEKPETDEVVEKLQERICALPTVEEWKAMSQEQQAEIYMEVQLAADIYFDELTEEQRKDVEAERLLALLEAFTQDIMALNSGDWQVIEGVLTVTGSISLADVSETYTSIDVKEGGSITAGTINCPITNAGMISGCTFGTSASVKANTGTIKVPAKIDGATMWFDYKTRVKAALLELTDYPLEENQVWAYYNKYGGRNVELSATTTFDLINTDYFRGWKCRINYVSQVGPADALAASVDYVLTSEPYTTGLMNFSSKETYENYTFLGWSEDRNAATATYDRKGVHGASRITLTKDKPVVTLWAVWQGDYHIVLNIVDETITYGESILVEATVTDGHGNPVSDGTLKFGFNGQEYGEIVQNGNVFSWEIPTVDENNKNAGIIRKGLNYIYAIYTTADGSKSFDSRGGYIRLKPLEVTPVLMSDNCVWSPAGISTNQIKIGFVTKDDSETVYQLGCFKTVKDSDGNTVTSMQTAGQYTVDVTELLSGGPFVADKDMVQLVDNKSLTFTVEKLDLGDASVIIEPLRETKVYDGSPVSTDASLYSIKTVEDGQIYCIDSGWQAEIIPDKNSTEAGTAYVQISANPDAQNIKGSREVTLTIVKAPAEITGTTAYNKIYGDEDFNLSMVKTGEEGTLNYAVISGEENLSVTEDGTVTIKKAGTSVIRVSMAETNNYMAAEDVDVTISIAKAAGSGSVTLEDWVYSPDGSTVKNPTVLSDTNGTDQVTCLYKVKDADDSTYTTEQPVNAGVYTVKAIFAATDNYLEASAETDFVIEKAEKPENTPEGENTKIEASATMESLKDIVLPDGWSWTDDSIKLIPGGTVTATAVYEDTANYKEHQVEIQIYKAEEVVEDDETEKETDDTTDDETEKETDDKTDDETEKETDGKTDDETEKETNGKNNHQTNNKPNNKPNNKTTSPKTGDESPIGLYVLILLAGAVGMAGAVLAKKKENKKIL